ncbi:hypothetical protein BDK51DRAFT_50438 [Blyttiomyces helicus]|uniref:Uncharacterized protein n=1 Tax=Blyttiomyces helicus TaxID=388810 RepID=A0A4P9W2P4_9FUNG|nr:hypothetical protein BDK51DRAFT_50438 [Blyttiomyces helicus]|eukprot:RKO86424.1 hypothetical protein BDK51DRAFT_50438 [Blyttiomyces helicus]
MSSPPPALLTMISIFPNSRLTSSRSLTPTATEPCRIGNAAHANQAGENDWVFAASAHDLSELYVNTTSAPREASSAGLALPIPREAPVTSATFPARS